MGNATVTMVLVQLFLSFVILLVVQPLVGAALLVQGFRLAKIEGCPRGKVTLYFVGVCGYSYLALIPLSFAFKESIGMPVVRAAFVTAFQLLVLPFLLRNFSRRALLVQGGAVVLSIVLAHGLLELVPTAD